MEKKTLRQLLARLKSTEPSVTYKSSRERQASDPSAPHSCSHCGEILIDREGFAEKPVVSHGEDRYHRVTDFTVKVEHDLDYAFVAARAGCLLFEWLLDCLAEGLVTGPFVSDGFVFQDVVFNLAFETEDGVSCGLIIDAVSPEGEKLRVLNRALAGEPWLRLAVYAHRDDPASALIAHRPAETDVFSERSQAFAKECMDTCLKYHEQCRTQWLKADLSRVAQDRHGLEEIDLTREVIAIEDLPTRLLSLETQPNGTSISAKLVEISALNNSEKSHVAATGYAALSYCWGREGNPIQLNRQTRSHLSQGFDASTLPATIYEAIQFASALGLKYMWIDALCVVQDDDQDKLLEIARMGAYYGTNTLTLCAASADGSSRGLGGRGLRSLYKVPPISLACSVGTDVGRIILHSALEVREPITDRGWTMQESLLSRRILIFSDQVYWCCVTANAECEGVMDSLSQTPNRNFGSPESLVPGIYPAQVLRDYPPEIQWYLGTSNFTQRRLGVESDKLLAISAFAAWVHARYRACGGPPTDRSTISSTERTSGSDISYAAGLFLSPGDPDLLVNQLIWQPMRTSSCTRPKVYRAPSWSWAAVDGDLKLCSLSLRGSFKLRACEVQLADESAPYGSVCHAALHLADCLVRPLLECLEFPVRLEASADAPNDNGVSILPDTPADEHLMRQAIAGGPKPKLCLLQLSDTLPVRPISEELSRVLPRKFYSCVGLVISPVNGMPSNVFQRVGLFDFYRTVHPSDTEHDKRMDTFFEVAGQDVILI